LVGGLDDEAQAPFAIGLELFHHAAVVAQDAAVDLQLAFLNWIGWTRRSA
jgi:hypothetical protein